MSGVIVGEGFDYTEVAPDTATLLREHAARIRAREDTIVAARDAIRTALLDVLRTGRDLVAVKEALSHGRFDDWCEAELGYSKNTALRRMRAYTTFGGLLENATVAFLPSVSLVNALSDPSCPEPAKPLIPRLCAGDRSAVIEAKEVLAEAKASKKRSDCRSGMTEERQAAAERRDASQAHREEEAGEVVEAEPAIRPASHRAVDEIVAIMIGAMGYDAGCVANLIRHGLGDVLMISLDAATANLGADGPEHLEPEEIADTEAETLTLPWESEAFEKEPEAVAVSENRGASSQAPTLSPLVQSLLDDARSVGGRQGSTNDVAHLRPSHGRHCGGAGAGHA